MFLAFNQNCIYKNAVRVACWLSAWGGESVSWIHVLAKFVAFTLTLMLSEKAWTHCFSCIYGLTNRLSSLILYNSHSREKKNLWIPNCREGNDKPPTIFPNKKMAIHRYGGCEESAMIIDVLKRQCNLKQKITKNNSMKECYLNTCTNGSDW